MYVIFAVAVIAALLYLFDRALKALRQGRRRRAAAIRLAVAAAQAEYEQMRRRQASEASSALTAVLPAILERDHGPRRVA